MDALFAGLHSQLLLNVTEGNRQEWLLSAAKNDALVDSRYSRAAKRLGKRAEAWHEPHLAALEQFNARKERGMDLSDRVWRLTDQFRGELEMALELGLGDGKSAADLSRDVRQYLQEPHKLFRRVRNEKGQLRLSKAAAAYNPGQGVYRSSYKNALRLTTTENNMAYRTADHERWQDLDFVIGIEIMLSNNHPVEDVCDALCGIYPKTFKFVGWHPFCRCIAVPKLADEDEFIARQQALIDGKDVPEDGYTGEVTELPECFSNWVQENAERIENANTLPYFIQDNRAVVKAAMNPTPPQQTAPRPTVEQIAAKRHAERDDEAVQEAWNERRMRNFRNEQDRYDLTDAQQQQINDIFDRLNDANFFDPQTEFNPIWEELQKMFEPILKAQTEAGLLERISKITTIDDTDRGILQMIAKSNIMTSKDKLARMRGVAEGMVDKNASHTLVSALTRYAKESPVIAKLQEEWIATTDALRSLEMVDLMKKKCAIKTRWDLRKWGATPVDKVSYESMHSNYIMGKGRTLTTRTGVKVEIKDFIQDLIEFRDKAGTRYYYPIGISKTEIPIGAGTAAEALAELPKYIRENLSKGVVFTNKEHPLDAFYRIEYKNFTRGAMYSGDPVTVHCPYGKENFKSSISHEVGHHIDLKVGWRLSPSEQKQWSEAVKKDGDYIREYSKNSVSEDFADSVSAIANDPESFKRKFPNRYKIIERIVKGL